MAEQFINNKHAFVIYYLYDNLIYYKYSGKLFIMKEVFPRLKIGEFINSICKYSYYKGIKHYQLVQAPALILYGYKVQGA